MGGARQGRRELQYWDSIGATEDAAVRGDAILVLVTDESQPAVWREQIAPGVGPGNLLVWASGYNVGYGLIVPPGDVDVVMVAPRMPGSEVRALFERGSGSL